MLQFPSELEHDECSPYLEQSSPPLDSNTGFSGKAISSIICLFNYQFVRPLKLSHKDLLTVSGLHGAITSSALDHGTILGVHSGIHAPSVETAFHHAISSSVPNSLPSLVRVESVGNQPGLTESGRSPGQLKFDIGGTTSFHPHSLPEYHDGLSNVVHLNSPGTMTGNINSSPPERFDNRQLRRVSLNGHPIELSEAGKCNRSLGAFSFS